MNTTDHPGLSPAEAERRLQQARPNRLFTPAPVRFWAIAWDEIREPMILLLLIVGFFYSLWGSLGDAITIFIVILCLVAAEVINEFRAKRAIAALERLSAPKARVRRGGEVTTIDTEKVVVGDVLILVPGVRLPADAKLLSVVDFSVDEGALTGESLPVEKSVDDAVFAGTVVAGGEGEAEVTATGRATRLGQMAAQLGTVKPPKTRLQLAMNSLAGKLAWVALFFSIVIPLIGVARGGPIRQMILTGLSLAFAIIPEELPIIITMVLALGACQLSQRKFLVKRLSAAETLGDATVIVTDKTGTLTENRMQVAAVWAPQQERAALETALGTVSPEMPDALEQAEVERAKADGVSMPKGEILRLRYAGNGRRSKAALWRNPDRTLQLDLTGAPEDVFSCCRDVPPEARAFLEREAAQGRRVIAAATRPVEDVEMNAPFSELERGLYFQGIVSLADPPRPEIKKTLAQVTRAGIRTIMVTGDHPATAAAIARDVGLPADRVLMGDQLNGMDEKTLAQTVRQISVCARTTPQHKYRIVLALEKSGEVVVVTGDGVNDALALEAADVGVAMGIRGTDVAKEAAQAVLADDNYATLARGVFEGRHFSDNFHKGVNYYLAVKVGLITIFLFPVLAGLPLPFSPIQIILLEMFMDLAASAGFVAEPAESDITLRPPPRTTAPFLDRTAVMTILSKGAALFLAVMAAYTWATWRGLSIGAVQSCAFTSWMIGHVALAFISRRDREPLLRRGFLSNHVMNIWALAAIAFLVLALYAPPIREALRFAEITPRHLLVSSALAILLVGPVDLLKRLRSTPEPKVKSASVRP
jgi:Ca2+-transporting ATPase